MVLDKIMMVYGLVINLVGFVVMGMDKARARRRAWRISERILFFVAAVGGAAGAWLGMYVFHHKTKHWYFVIGMPLLLLIQVIIVLVIAGV